MKHILVLFWITLLFSCANKEEVQPIEDTIVVDIIDSIPTETSVEDPPKWVKVFDFNAEERLLEYGEEHLETKIVIKTTFGDIKVELFEDTPLHRASMILMIKKGILSNTKFYRISDNFIIQAGLTAGPGAAQRLASIGNYKVPAEIKSKYPHVSGAFAMAGEDFRPGIGRDKRSNPFTFYIVEGEKQTNKSLKHIENAYFINIPDEMKTLYKKKGGAPHLDGQYTVCGKVIEGMDVVKAISKVEVNQSHHPLENIYLSIEILEE